MCPSSSNKGSQTQMVNNIDLRSVFGVLDRNGDGRIEATDLESFFNGKGLSRQEIEDMIRVADVNRDGSVDVNEFHSLLFPLSPLSSSTSSFLRAAFDVIDRNADGVVTVDDLRSFLLSACGDLSLPDEDVAAMIDVASCSGSSSGSVRFEDFVRLMTAFIEA